MSIDIEKIKSQLKDFLESSLEEIELSLVASTFGEIARAVGLPKTAAKIEALDWEVSINEDVKIPPKATKSATKPKKAAKDEEPKIFIKLLDGTIGRLLEDQLDEKIARVSKGRGRPIQIPISELKEVNSKEFQFKQIEPDEEENPKKPAKKIATKTVKEVTETPVKAKRKKVKVEEEEEEEGSTSDWE